MARETKEDKLPTAAATAESVPGIVILWSAGRPTLRAVPIEARASVGREADVSLDDDTVSREHAEIIRADGRFVVRDANSRNGTFVHERADEIVVRFGQSVGVLLADITPFSGGEVSNDGGRITGPVLARTFDRIARIARVNKNLLVHGPTGAGKELAAQAFHEAAGGGPFVPVNCAAIPEGLAERVLFGAKKGAYSGAAEDASGFVQAAHLGTLFLDEIAELDPRVQPKLLRVLESRSVVALGDTVERPVEVRVCAATHVDLRSAVANDRFREDLYFRLGRPEVKIAPITARYAELVTHVANVVEAADPALTVNATVIEACLMREWPGNVRELRSEVERAAHEAIELNAREITTAHLGEDAGRGFAQPDTQLSQNDIARALKNNNQNVSAAARALGLHRTQLRRLIDRFGL